MATQRSTRAHEVAAFLLAVLACCSVVNAQYAAQLSTPKGKKASSSTAPLGTKYCWDLTAFNQPGGGCDNFDLRKIEFDVSLDCRGTVAEMTFNNQKLGVSFQSFGSRGLVLKFVRPNGENNPLATHASLVGKKTPICFTLYAGKCGTLSKFCRNGKTCDIAFFSPNLKCYSVNGW